jgi:hypothetical protein
MRFTALFLALSSAIAAGAAQAVTAPPASLGWTVRDLAGKELDYGEIDLTPVLDGDKVVGFEVDPLAQPILVRTLQNGELVTEARIDNVSGGGLWDPSFVIGYAVTDFGAPSVFGFTLSSPLIPTVQPVPQIKASIAGTLTDLSGDGASITSYSLAPFGPVANAHTVRLNPGDVNPGVDGGPSATLAASGVSGTFLAYAAPGQATFYAPGPSAAETLNGPAGSYTDVVIASTFRLSGGGDAFAGTSFVEITPVPEPGTWALVLAGLSMVGAVARRATKA